MDFSALLLPGAQKLATAMLGDAWAVTRDALARRWGHGDRATTAEATAELDDARSGAIANFGADQADQRLLNAYLAGYLAAMLRAHPDRGEALLSMTQDFAPPAVGRAGNVNSGRVEKLVQVDGDLHGGVHM